MNEIRLARMELRNFKGIKQFTLDINGLTANVFGENGTGKTTLYDGFLWILFNKDSANRADFSVKPQGKNGNDINYLETEVVLHLLIDGRPKILRKMLEEVWTKKRGEASKEFTGHQTSYWIDTVPVKKKEYTDQINSIIDENAFKLLTNPFYFCTQLKWEDRRKTLMEICGDVSDADVIASDKSLAALTDILSGRSINDQRKIIAERIKKLNKDIDAIPIKINELSRTLLSEDVNYQVVEENLLAQKAVLRKIEQSMTDASQTAAEYRQNQQDLFKLTAAMDERKKELDAGAMAGLNRAIDEKSKLEGERYRVSAELSSSEANIKSSKANISDMENELVTLRARWNSENEKQFVDPDPDMFICPTCQQSLPQEKKETQITQMRANFESTKAHALAKINEDGKAIASRINIRKNELEELESKLILTDLKRSELAERLTELNKEIEAERQRTFGANYEADAKYSTLQAQFQALKTELNKPIEDQTSELIQRKNEVAEKINELNKVLNNRDVQIRTQERIEELKDEERSLAGQLSEFEGHKYLIEQFVKAKVNLLEDTINSRFEIVKWKLFKVNINGGIEECCEAMADGVTWPNVNHAGKVNSGLDIINVLAGHYGCTAPIFIDFRESVSRIIETKSQVVNLIKSEPDKVLRVEVA
ncbi:MAG TPA: hypothetical protein DEF42_10265 [Desulfosporosinus sp.]|nr:hypothetical protein [Desulfosporosinus sp.]